MAPGELVHCCGGSACAKGECRKIGKTIRKTGCGVDPSFRILFFLFFPFPKSEPSVSHHPSHPAESLQDGLRSSGRLTHFVAEEEEAANELHDLSELRGTVRPLGFRAWRFAELVGFGGLLLPVKDAP